MSALDYLDSLIAGQGVSSIPIQSQELQLLKQLLEKEMYPLRQTNKEDPNAKF